MKKNRRRPLAALALAAALSLGLTGCQLPDALQLPGVDLSRIFGAAESAAPTATPKPTPTPEVELSESAARVKEFLNAVRDGDRDTVRAFCGDAVPGYSTEDATADAFLRTFYDTLYSHLEYKLGIVTETPLSATVSTEITNLDMKSVVSGFAEDVTALKASSGFAALDDAARREKYAALMTARLAACGETVTKKITVSLKLDGEQWKITAAGDLCAALTGGLTLALQDFALPADPARDVVLSDPDRELWVPVMGDDTCSFAVTHVYPNDPEGYVLEVSAANRSGAELVFSVRDALVNGFLLDPEWTASVPAGETQTLRLVWDRAAFALCGIASVERVEFTLDVFEKPAWPVYPRASASCSLSPGGGGGENESLNAASGQTLLNDGVSCFTVLETRSEGCWGYEMTVYAENNSQEELWFSLGETKLNGADLDPGWSLMLPAGKKAVQTIRWNAGELLLHGVAETESVDFLLTVSSVAGLDQTEGNYSAGGHFSLGGGT